MLVCALLLFSVFRLQVKALDYHLTEGLKLTSLLWRAATIFVLQALQLAQIPKQQA